MTAAVDGDTNEVLKRKLGNSERQVAALKDAVLKLRASSSEVQKLSVQQQKQHEDDVEALRQSQKREAELLRRCEAAELRATESGEACRRAEAVARELKAREQSGNALVPADLVSGLQTLGLQLSNAGEPKSKLTHHQNKDVVNSAVLFCEGAVNLLKAALSPRQGSQKRQRTIGPLEAMISLNNEHSTSGDPNQASDSTSLEDKVVSSAEPDVFFMENLMTAWFHDLLQEGCTLEEIKVGCEKLLVALRQRRQCSCQSLVVHLICTFIDCCRQLWESPSPESSGSPSTSCHPKGGATQNSMKREGFAIEDHKFASFWMQEAKLRSQAYTRLLGGIFHMHSLIQAEEGADLLEELQLGLKEELVVRRQNIHHTDLWVDCGLATALTAVLRQQQNIQAARALVVDIVAVEEMPAGMPLLAAVLEMWPEILNAPHDDFCDLLLVLLQNQCHKALDDGGSNKDDSTQAGSILSGASEERHISATRQAAECILAQGQIYYGWPFRDKKSEPGLLCDETKDVSASCEKALQLLWDDSAPWGGYKQVYMKMTLHTLAAFQGLSWICEEVTKHLRAQKKEEMELLQPVVQHVRKTMLDIQELHPSKITVERIDRVFEEC